MVQVSIAKNGWLEWVVSHLRDWTEGVVAPFDQLTLPMPENLAWIFFGKPAGLLAASKDRTHRRIEPFVFFDEARHGRRYFSRRIALGQWSAVRKF